MRKRVMLSISGSQTAVGKTPQVMELTTEGILAREGDVYAVSYVGTALTGLEGVVTTYRVDGKRLEITRDSPADLQLTFQEGERYDSLVTAGDRVALMSIITRRVFSDLTDCGGTLVLEYRVEIESIPVGESACRILVRDRNAGAGA